MEEDLLETEADDQIRLTVGEAQSLGESALLALGYDADEARIITLHLVDAAMSGYAFAGLPRILVMSERPEQQEPREPIRILRETPVSALLDGGNNVGYLAISRAVDIAIEKTRRSGIAMVALRNIWFGGRAAYYLEKIGRAGFGAIYTGSSMPTVVPPGAIRKALGTNPIAFALPGKKDPFIFDIGTASVMSGEVAMKALLNEEFSEAVGINKHGRPTGNARDLREGGIFPFGGHKGYGLSLTIQALGLLAGSRLENGKVCEFSYVIMVFDPEMFMPVEQFGDEVEELFSKIRSLPKQAGVEEIRIPSERGFREREIRRSQGILLSKTIYDRLSAL